MTSGSTKSQPQEEGAPPPLPLSRGRNFEFQYYTNNRSTSFVRDGILYIRPTLLSDRIGDIDNGYTLDLWGLAYNDLCTSNAYYGCSRTVAPGHVTNPLQSARLRTARSFAMRFGTLEVRAKLPRGDWLWPVPSSPRL